MDLTLDVEDYKLNIRAAGLLVHNNKILTHTNKEKGHYALIGGRIAIGEDSVETVKREILEEIGKEVEVIGYIGTIENFFEMKGQKYHEIMFIHQVEFINDEDKKILETLDNLEGKDYLKYEWLDIEKLDEYELLPVTIKEILKEGKFPVHRVNNELK